MLSKTKDLAHKLLHWSEKHLKTDMRYLARGGFWSIVGQVASSLCSFLLAIIVSRYLPKEVYGEYKYIIAAVALLSTFTLNNLGTAVFQSTARGFDGALQQGFRDNIRWSSLMFVGAFALATYYFALHNGTLAIGILIGGCLMPFLTSANFVSGFLGAKKDFARQSMYLGVWETLIATAALIVTIFITKSPLILSIVYFASNTFATLYFYKRVVRIYAPDKTKTDSGMLSYGKHLSVMGVIGGIANNLDQILLFHYMGPADLAVYNFATAIPDQTRGPIKTLDSMVQVRFAERTSDDIRKNARNKMVLIFLFFLIFVALYIFFAPFIFRIFFPNYMDSVLYSQVYALSLLSVSFGPAASYLMIKKRIKEQYVNTVALSILPIIAMFIGVIGWGVMGVIVARVFTRFLGGFLSIYFLYRPLKTGVAE